MTPVWQRAATHPSWIRWLPCALAYLTLVPHPRRFRRSAWGDVVPWDDPAWCDPGDIAEWVTRARQRQPWRGAEHAEQLARARYAQVVRVRETRVELFTEMCRRRDVAAPHTVTELLACLAGLGLFDLDGDPEDPWVRPHLDLDPLDVLPLSSQEYDLEELAQRGDRTVQVAIAVRRLALRTRRRWPRRRTVATTLGTLARLAEVTREEAGRALADLAGVAGLRTDPASPPDSVRITVTWPDFRQRFPYAELPAPEHDI